MDCFCSCMGVTFSPWPLGCWQRLRDVFRIKGTPRKSAAKATHGVVTVSSRNITVHIKSDLIMFTEDNLNKVYKYVGIISELFVIEKR